MKYLILLLLLLPVGGAFAQSATNIEALKQQIEKRLSQVEGEFAVAFKDLQSGQSLYINEKTSFHAASTMKTPVMIEVFKQAAEGKFRLSDSILVKNEFKSIVDGSPYSMDIADDSADGMYSRIGRNMTIYDLTYQMIIRSSNLATNILIDLIDAKKANATMRSIGANDIQVLRGVEDDKAYQLGLNNTVTAYDLALIYEHLARKAWVSRKASKKMLAILFDQQFNEIIPARLPKDAKVAHKTGSITGVQHDSGIVYLPNGKKYVLVLLSRKLSDTEAGIKALAEVSEMVYAFVK